MKPVVLVLGGCSIGPALIEAIRLSERAEPILIASSADVTLEVDGKEFDAWLQKTIAKLQAVEEPIAPCDARRRRGKGERKRDRHERWR